MKLELIENLLEFLPDNSPYLTHHGQKWTAFQEPLTIKLTEVDKFAICRDDPKFGWHFVRSIMETKTKLSDEVTDPFVRRAYEYEKGQKKDRIMCQVLSLERPSMRWNQWIIKSMLVGGMTIENTAKQSGFPEEVIQYYDQLFFNITDRKDDRAYMAKLTHPETRKSSWMPDYALRENAGMLMQRAAFDFGPEAAVDMAGVTNGIRPIDATTSMSQVESFLLSGAVNDIKFGMSRGNNSAAIRRSLTMINAQKQGGNEQANQDSTMGLGALSMTGNIMETLRILQSPDVVDRQRLADAQAEIRAKKEKLQKAAA